MNKKIFLTSIGVILVFLILMVGYLAYLLQDRSTTFANKMQTNLGYHCMLKDRYQEMALVNGDIRNYTYDEWYGNDKFNSRIVITHNDGSQHLSYLTKLGATAYQWNPLTKKGQKAENSGREVFSHPVETWLATTTLPDGTIVKCERVNIEPVIFEIPSDVLF